MPTAATSSEDALTLNGIQILWRRSHFEPPANLRLKNVASNVT